MRKSLLTRALTKTRLKEYLMFLSMILCFLLFNPNQSIAQDHDCLIANGTPGCTCQPCQDLICGADSFCCSVEWDQICADAAAQQAICLIQDCITNEPSDHNCLEPHGGLGCTCEPCQLAVCGADAFCCDVSWDQICADAAAVIPECQGNCPPFEPIDHDCLEANGTPGCTCEPCQDMVCGADPFCCDVTWDQICADAAAALPVCQQACPECPEGAIMGDDFVCPGEEVVYEAIGFDFGNGFWSLLDGGGVFTSPTDEASVSVLWDDTPGGPYRLVFNGQDVAGCNVSGRLDVYIEGLVSLACNDGLQVSLNEMCMAVITADIMLEGPQFPDMSYDVEVRDENGEIVPDDKLTAEHIGQTLQVKVTHECYGSSCWGNITVEDKIPPDITCNDVTIECTDSTDPSNTGYPDYVENCGDVTFSYYDEEVQFGCTDEKYASKINRYWVATDASGNTDECTQMIWKVRASIDDIDFPLSWDGLPGQQDPIKCGTNYPVWPQNGNPHPDKTGYPTGIECFNINYYFTDVNFEVCGANEKILRQWTVIDWCTQEQRTHDQVIKIEDNEGPVVTCKDDFFDIPNDPGLCTGTLNPVPPPVDIFDCSETTWTVAYKLADENGDPYDNPITDNVRQNPDGSLYIFGLPMDSTWLIYTVTDACGRSNQCFTEIFVRDVEPPTAVCEGHTVVSLGEDGWADVYAETFDDHSWDNCGPVDSFQVKRYDSYCPGKPEDLEFGDKVNFCCEDVANSPIKVVVRVYDAEGLYNDCVVEVTVTDKFDPVITHCPGPITVNCDTDTSDPMNTGGYPLAEDNCDVTISFRDQSFVINDCGIGHFTRVWTATDPGGLTDKCTQRITLVDLIPFDEDDINWPEDDTVIGCTAADAHPDETGKPTTSNDECVDIAISYEDELFYDFPGLCLKILRHWTLIDWCNYDLETDRGVWRYSQKISIVNTQAPWFTSDCQGQTVKATGPNCSAYVELIETADDDCTPSSLIQYRWEIDAFNNGGVEFSDTGNDASDTYPAGTHKITFYATDQCDNTSTCTYLFTVEDQKDPTPVCLSGLSFPLPSHSGEVTIWASDFNLDNKSEDDCTAKEDLDFSFSLNRNDRQRTFDCDDLDNGVYMEIELDVYVWDEAGNYSFCTTSVLITDNKNICPDAADASAAVAGRVFHESDQGVEEVMLNLSNLDENASQFKMTDTDGDYAFAELELYDDYEVSPSKADLAINGVSTLDLVLIQKHILGVSEFDSPYKRIAADVNNSYSITASDLVLLRKLILGVIDAFPAHPSWRFVDAHHEFYDETKPWPYPKAISVDSLLLNMMEADFVAVKMGDVSGNAKLNNAQEQSTEIRQGALTIDYRIERVEGDIQEVVFSSADFEGIAGMQATLMYDASKYVLVGNESGAIRMTADQLGQRYAAEGMLSLSWHEAKGQSLSTSEDLFSLQFRALNTTEVIELELSDEITKTEVYNASLETVEMVIERVGDIKDTKTNELVLHQNRPNPFTDATSIAFELPEASKVVLQVMDIQGKTIKRIEGDYSKGYHEIELLKEDLPSVGILYYHIATATATASKKMIMIE